MTFREGPRPDRGTPQTWTAWGAAALALLIAVVMLLADKREALAQSGGGGRYGAARNEFDEMAAPVMGVLSAPFRFLADASTDVRGYFFAVSENRRLRERLREMERWRDAAIALKNVNERYESLLRLRTEPAIPMVSARVVADARGPFSNARLADAGTADGVSNGQPVLSEHGVVGRVVGAGPRASRVLLLTDADSRTPVLVDRTNARAILTGDGGANPRLEYLRGGDTIKDGDVLLTSGDGGVYPRGLPIGVAAKDLRGIWRARLYADRQALDYVRILTFVDFAKLAREATLVSDAPPPLDPTQAAQLQATLAAKTAPPPGASTSATKVDTPRSTNATVSTGATVAIATAPSASKPPSPLLSPPPPSGSIRGPSVGSRAAEAASAAAHDRRPALGSSPRAVEGGGEPRAPKPRTSEAGDAGAPRAAKPRATPADDDTPARPHRTSAAAARASTPGGETSDERARRLRLRALTRDAAKPAATMKPIPDPQDER